MTALTKNSPAMVRDFATRIELEKLAEIAALEPTTLDTLAHQETATSIRRLRFHLEARRFHRQQRALTLFGRSLRWLPVRWQARLAPRIGALLCARMLGAIHPYKAARIARRQTPAFLAECTRYVEPAAARPLLSQLPVELIQAGTLILAEQGEYRTLARLADAVSLPAIRALANSIKDDAALLNIAFHMDDMAQLNKIVLMLDNERIERIVHASVMNPSLWHKALWVVINLDDSLIARLANRVAERSIKDLEQLITITQQQQLWAPMLQLLSYVHPRHYRKILNLPSLHQQPVMQALVDTALDQDLAGELLGLMQYTSQTYQKLIATTILEQDVQVAEAALQAAYDSHHLDVILDMAQLLTDCQKDRLAQLDIASDRWFLERLMQTAYATGKLGALLDFARHMTPDGLNAVAELSLKDDGNLIEALLDEARKREDGWELLGDALAGVMETSLMAPIYDIYRRQPAEDRAALADALDQLASRTGFAAFFKGSLDARPDNSTD
ncbi:MAG: hypothetical protein LAT63_04385 [Marinobacter sp.]|nr:hypothetical protein [Marinobacter sp.]